MSDPPARGPVVKDSFTAAAPRGPLTSWCGIPDFPYAIRISEFGIPESGIGVQRFLHAMKDSPLTRWIMVR